ncbi:MAG: toprim domain-containing protein, partial [Chloroflexia bacterium]
MIGTSSRPEEMRDALRCGMPGCKCAQPRGNVHCPSHPDEHPSLSISERDGTTLVHCHAGCTQDAVFAALRERGLWPSRADASRWELRTADGGHVATHVRTDRPDGAKSVRWEQPDGRPGLGGVSTSALPVYGAERLNGATEVVVAEGEPAADALLEKDIAAVATVTGASGTPSDDSLQLLLGRTVYLWPDADTAGIEHMDRLGERLRALGCEDVRVVRGVDAADVVGGDVRRLLSKARPWQPPKPNLLLKGSPCEVRLPEVYLADVKPSDGQGPLPSLPLLDQSAYVIEWWS